jgi:hypothetical protein
LDAQEIEDSLLQSPGQLRNHPPERDVKLTTRLTV